MKLRLFIVPLYAPVACHRSRILILCLQAALLLPFSQARAQEIEHTSRYYVHRAENYVGSNAWNSAKREIDAGLKVYPDDPDLRYLNGRYYFVIGDMDEARYQLVRATQTDDMHFRAKRVLVDVEDQLGHWSSAICYINELLEYQPYDRDLWRRKIGFYRRMGNEHEADDALERLSRIYPNDSLVLADVRRRNLENWGNVLKGSSMSEAANNLERWIDRDPTVLEYYLELVNTYIKMGEYEKAIGAANRGLHYFPDNKDLIHKTVSVMSDLGLYSQALAFAKSHRFGSTVYNNLLREVAEDARMRDPYESHGRLYMATHDREALAYLINTSLTRGYFDDARMYIEEAIKRDGRTPGLLMKLYSLEKKSGNENRAVKLLTELYEKNPYDEEVRDAYVDMMLKLSNDDFAEQQWDEAYRHLNRVLELMPDTAEAWPSAVSRQITVLGHLGRMDDAHRLCVESSIRNKAYRYRFSSAYEDFAASRLKGLIEEERYEEALSAAQDLLEVIPSSEAALRCLINMSQTLKRKELFHEAAAMGYDAYPEVPYFIIKQAVALQECYDYEGALALLHPRKDADEYVNPQLTAAFSGISQEWAGKLIKNKRLQKALEVTDTALVFDPLNRELLYTKGVVHEHLKDYATAYEYQQRYYEPSNAEQGDYVRHIRYLGYKALRNRVDATYTHALYDTRQGTLSSVSHLYSIGTVSYARLSKRNTYTFQVSYKGIDGYRESFSETEVDPETGEATTVGLTDTEPGGVGLEFMAQWEHQFNAKWSGMVNAAVSTQYFNKLGANISLSYAAPRGWTPSLRLGYRRTPPTYLYLGGASLGSGTNEEHNLYLVSPSLEKSWEYIKVTGNADLTFMSNSLYYNAGLKGKLFINNDNVSSVSLITGFGSFPELSFFEQTALQNVSHTNAMVGIDLQYLCTRHLSLGLAGSWNTCYNPFRRSDGTLESSYRNIFSIAMQFHLAF